ncbi:hypothetical protein PGQ11_001486 [Apiospora arundinis]|uniref:DUF6594 domain-containing protein n=1 Tax=Apiospora arundinis TaxID=335852 RepID=A0ABR2JN10_9PEZI
MSNAISHTANGSGGANAEERVVEDFRKGYPRYSALISSHSAFHVFRRFRILRVRLLLSKQDELSALEKQLNDVDRKEKKPLFLGALRSDANSERRRLLSNIDVALAEYDALAERNETALKRGAPRTRDVRNLANWLDNNGGIARDETEYIENPKFGEDLMAVGALGHDYSQDGLEGPITDALVLGSKLVGRRVTQQSTIDPHVHILSHGITVRLTKALLVTLLLAMLAAPIIISTVLDSVAARLTVTLVACAVFVIILTVLTRARIIELFVAGATYTAILVVFITSDK